MCLLAMKRQEAREQAFLLIYESGFKNEPIDELIDVALESRKIKMNTFSKRLLEGVNRHKNEIDSIIEKNSIGWKKNRISKVAISIMRLAVYEMMYERDIPESVSINEAVEITKKYSTKDESSFVNGVLGSIAKDLEKPSNE